jgi:hypothetical protein
MSIWALLPVLLGTLVVIRTSVSKALPLPPVPNPPANFIPEKPLYFRSWPWLNADSRLWAYSSTVTAGSSSNPLDIEAFQPDELTNALQIVVPQGTSCKIGPTSSQPDKGFMFITGSALITASWLVITPLGTQSMSKALSSEYIAVPISKLASTITLQSVAQKGPRRTTRTTTLGTALASTLANTLASAANDTIAPTAYVWTDEYNVPTFGQYVMQPFLEASNALVLHIVADNSTFSVEIDAGLGTETYPINLLATTNSAVAQTPYSFMTAVQQALAAQIPNNESNALLQFYVESFDTMDPSQLHVCTSFWLGPNTFKIIMPTTSATATAATAATFGHYSNGPDGTATIVPVAVASGSAGSYSYRSPGPCIVQWPLTFTINDFQQAGSADTDGFISIALGTNDDPDNNTPLMNFTASTLDYYLYAPTTQNSRTFGAYIGFAYVPSTLTIQSVGQGGSRGTFTSSLINILGLNVTNTSDWLALVADHASIILKIYDSSGTSVSTTTTFQDIWSNTDGPEGSLSTLSATLDPYVFEPAASIVRPTGLEDITTKIEILSASLEVLCTFETSVVFDSLIQTSLRADDASSDPVISKLNQLFSASSLAIDAWAGGGASMLDQHPVTYGGASGHVAITVEPQGMHTLHLIVGPAGKRDNFYRCTGGSRTSLEIDGVVLFDIGGGGGSALGSHGGAGGMPRDAEFNRSGGPSQFVWPGYSGSTDPFTVPTNQPLGGDPPYAPPTPQQEGPFGKPTHGPVGPSGPSGPNIIETFQGSGSGIDQQGDPGYYFSGSSKVLGFEGGIGGSGYGPEGPMYGGTGAKMQTSNFAGLLGPYGAGGGGATMVLNTSDWPTFSIVVNAMNPPWLSYAAGPYSVPLGGGSVLDPLQQQNNYCMPTSVLSLILKNVWTSQQHVTWVSTVLSGIAKAVTSDNGFLASPDSSQNYMFPTEDAFVNAVEPANDMPVVSYVPMGPHDSVLPGYSAPNVRPVSTYVSGNVIAINNPSETALFADNTVLCVHNDGQVDPENIAYSINTPFTGIGVPDDTVVTGIRFGQSEPQGLYNSIYLTLSQSILNSLGPFTWLVGSAQTSGPYGTNGPTQFSSGSYIHGTLNNLYGTIEATSVYDKTVPLNVISQDASDSLNEAIYASLAHIVWPTTNVSTTQQGSWWPNAFTLPSDSDDGPTYLQELWPIENTDTNNLSFVTPGFLRMRIFLRPVYAPGKIAFGFRSIRHTFEYTGQEQYFTVPPWASSMNCYCYGAGGSSNSSVLSGADGSFARASFPRIQQGTLIILVGQGGGRPKPENTICCGGLDSTGTINLGGGQSGIYINDFPGSPLIVAGGGGSAGQATAGVLEAKIDKPSNRKYGDGIVGAIIPGLINTGYDALDARSGAGGAGFRNGSQGTPGHGGASGLSFVPTNGVLSGSLRTQKFYSDGIGQGCASTGIAGHGRVVIEINY